MGKYREWGHTLLPEMEFTDLMEKARLQPYVAQAVTVGTEAVTLCVPVAARDGVHRSDGEGATLVRVGTAVAILTMAILTVAMLTRALLTMKVEKLKHNARVRDRVNFVRSVQQG